MSENVRNNPLWQDLVAYANELDATLTVSCFVGWLRENRPQLDRLQTADLETMARECLYRFAHTPPDAQD